MCPLFPTSSCFSHYYEPTTHKMDRDQPYVKSFRTLLAFSSTIKAELAKEDHDLTGVTSLLETARSDTRRSHASSVKKAVGDWHAFSPSYSKKPFSLWGWDHDECARLLCPPDIEWNETYVFFTIVFTFLYCRSNKQDLRDPVKRSTLKLGPNNFPRFLWEGETMDDSEPTSGFLRHPILFAVSLKHIIVCSRLTHTLNRLSGTSLSALRAAPTLNQTCRRRAGTRNSVVYTISLSSQLHTQQQWYDAPPLSHCCH